MDKRYRYDGQYGQIGAVHLILGVLQVMQMGLSSTEAVGSLIVVHHLGPVSYLTMLTASKSLGVTSHGGSCGIFPPSVTLLGRR